MTISFSKSEMEHVSCPHNVALVITMKFNEYDMKRVLIDFRLVQNNRFGRTEPNLVWFEPVRRN